MIDDKSTPGRLSNLLAIAFVADQTLGPLSELLFQVREDCLAVVLVFGFLFVVMADDRSSPVHADLFHFQGCGIVALFTGSADLGVTPGSREDLLANLFHGAQTSAQDVGQVVSGEFADRFLANHASIGNHTDLLDRKTFSQTIHDRKQGLDVGGIARQQIGRP